MPPGDTINICLIGQKFMGRAHSNAYLKAPRFFQLPVRPVMHTICGRDRAELESFAARWGWQTASTDWRAAIADPAVNLVDITAPNDQHLEMALAALEAGKHVACEKPLAGSLSDARQMRDAAKKSRKCRTFVWYSYRRVPAVALAHRLVKQGRIGRIYHVRGYYLQDWAGPDVPLIWRFDKKVAGSGSHGDLGAHIIDMARFVTGDEIVEVSGAIQETFIKKRKLPSQGSAGGIASGSSGGGRSGRVDVDDATLFLARFRGGAVASFEATRMASGYQNRNGIEVHGEKGAISIDFEDMNVLRFFDATEDRATAGWHRIMVTHSPDHPYASNWWPDAHGLGYEHTFVNQAADMFTVLGGEQPVIPLPDFDDAYKTQQVLEAAVWSAAQRRPVKVAEVG
jgi:predicted dehydrogenase